jgi:adenine/guanine phosphoribosyltransferase-like PRPP-binding protein
MEEESPYYAKTLDALVRMIGSEKEQCRFRNEFFAIMQLYYDGLIEKNQTEKLEEQRATFEGLCEAGKSLAKSLYCSKPELEFPRDYILKNKNKILDFGSEKRAKKRHLAEKRDVLRRFGEQCFLFENYDIIAGASSGSFEPALLAASIIKKPYFFVRYSHMSEKDFYVHLPPHEKKREIAKKVAGKRVLFVDDALFSGKTAATMQEFIGAMKPKDMLCAATFMAGDDTDLCYSIEFIQYDSPCIFEVK